MCTMIGWHQSVVPAINVIWQGFHRRITGQVTWNKLTCKRYVFVTSGRADSVEAFLWLPLTANWRISCTPDLEDTMKINLPLQRITILSRGWKRAAFVTYTLKKVSWFEQPQLLRIKDMLIIFRYIIKVHWLIETCFSDSTFQRGTS